VETQSPSEGTVVVRRFWNSWPKCTVAIDALSGYRWAFSRTLTFDEPPSPCPMLYASMSCQDLPADQEIHIGLHGPCPHRIVVCIVKADNPREVYARLAASAGTKPRRSSR
jgi:hypothetical protein